MRLPTGAMIILPRQSQSATEVYVTHANVDWGAEALFARFADRDRDFIDIGAHIGYYSVYLSPCVRRSYAFEPDPRNLPGLRANAVLAGNIEIVPMAASSRVGVARLHVGHGSAISSLEGEDHGATIDVPITTIDAFLAAHPGVDVALIKTDIEGHDVEALRGMRETVALHHPLILTECHNETELPNICSGWGYTIYAFTRHHVTLKTDFQRMSPEDLRERWYKMVFLVPRRLDAAFAEIARPHS